MSAAKRGRVMLESDDEDEPGTVTPRASFPSDQPRPKKSHSKGKIISVVDEDDDDEDEGLGGGGNAGGGSAAGADGQDQDDMERKRRRQLAARWTQLEEDSDHDLSDGDSDGGSGSGTKRSALVQLRVQDSWRRGTPSRSASRLFAKEQPPSEDEIGDSSDSDDGLGGFIVEDEDDDDVHEGARVDNGKKKKKKKETKTRKEERRALRKRTKQGTSDMEESKQSAFSRSGGRRNSARGPGVEVEESPSDSSGGDDDDDDDDDDDHGGVPKGGGRHARAVSKRRRGKSKSQGEEDRGAEEKDKEEEEEEEEERPGRRKRARRSRGGTAAATIEPSPDKGEQADEQDWEDDEEEAPLKGAGKQKSNANRKEGKGKGEKGRKKKRNKVEEGEEAAPAVTVGEATGRSTRPRRKSSMVNYRDMLRTDGVSSSEEEDAGDRAGDGPKVIGGGCGKCGRDEDADDDDGFAENLVDDEDDDEDEDEEEEVKKRSKKKAAGATTRSSRRNRSRYGVSDDDDDEDDDGMVDDDEDDDEGDTSFSHAAFFHEMEATQDGGVSSLSMGTMTFKEAFLLYVEYIAKATQGDGAGEAFMKKYVAQPRIPEHARYGKAREMVEKKLRISGESLCGTWRQDFRDTIMRYPHYGYLHVHGDECHVADRCSACNRSNRTSVVAFLSGSEYEPNRVWDGLRWDKHLPKLWDNPSAMAISTQAVKATHFLGDTCKHKSHLFHSLTHYKLYLVSKVAAKINGDDDLEPENFRGEGVQTSKKKKKRCLNFSENEFESLSSLLNKADELNGVKWGGRVGVRGGQGKTFLQAGAASSILDWLSGEAQPGQYGDLDLGLEGGSGRSWHRAGEGDGQQEEDDEDEEEFHVGRGRRWRTVGSSGGRYG
eukprot:g11066.t1